MKIQWQLLLVFLVITVTLVSTFGIVFVNRSEKHIQSTRAFVQNKFDYMASKLDAELWRVCQNQFKVYNDPDIFLLSMDPEYFSNYQRTQLINGMLEDLTSMEELYDCVECSYLAIPPQDKLYGTVKGVERLSQSDINLEHLRSQYNTSWQTMDGSLMIVTAYPNGLHPNIAFMVLTKLSNAAFENVLEEISDAYCSNLLLTTNDRRWQIARCSSPAVQEQLQAMALSEEEEVEDDCLLTPIFNGNLTLVAKLETSNIADQGTWNFFWILMTLLLVGAVMIFSMMISHMISQPVKTLFNAFSLLEQGDFSTAINYNRNDEFLALYEGYNSMTSRLKHLITENYENEIMMRRAEMKLLQAQISPHFLYNSFYNIYSMAQLQDFEGIQLLTSKLTTYYRYITRNQADYIELVKEHEFTITYIEIQQIRFGERIRVVMDPLPQLVEKWLVPKLFMQPMVENSYMHGLKDIEEDGILRITYHADAQALLIVIENNGKNISDDELAAFNRRFETMPLSGKGEITGMVNTHHRIRMLFGEDSGIRLTRSELGGLRVEISLKPTERRLSHV